MPPMIDYEITFPEGYDDYAWEVEAKGWLPDVIVNFDGRRCAVTFYDPIRLAQDTRDELARSGLFFVKNLVVVPCVSRAKMESAIANVVKNQAYGSMVAESETYEESPR